MVADDRISLSGGARQAQLPGPGANNNYEAHLTVARAAVAQDPKRVAQVVKNWVGTDA
jgi:flagellar M-ring protein FliF